MNEEITRAWEDVATGEVHEAGPYHVTEDAIFRFAEQFDPQYFHMSHEGAARGPFGKLTASGWHTCSITMRLMTEGILSTMDSQGAPGVKSVRWLKPTFVDDRLTLSTEILDTYPSRSRPAIGFCHVRHSVSDQHGTLKMVMENVYMVGRRKAAA